MSSDGQRARACRVQLRTAARWYATRLATSAALLVFSLGVAGAQLAEVRMQGEQFVPDRIVVKVGSTVRWTNTEKRTSHSVHFVDEGLPESERIFPGETWERRFDKPGVFPYVCGPHPAMKGVVEVK